MVYDQHNRPLLAELDKRVLGLVPRCQVSYWTTRDRPWGSSASQHNTYTYLLHLRTVERKVRELDLPQDRQGPESQAALEGFLAQQTALKEEMHTVRTLAIGYQLQR